MLTTPMNNEQIQEHIAATYNRLRLGMGLISFITPLIIVGWGLQWGVSWQPSLSAYYFAPRGNDWTMYSSYPTRVFFCGLLFALGAYLILYRGFTKWENWLLNIAGWCALAVAVFPMYPEAHYIPDSNKVHFGSAVVLFVCIGLTAIFCHKVTLRYVQNAIERKAYQAIYYVTGWFMLLFPIIGLILAVLTDSVKDWLFWIETAGIWVFSFYWLTKTIELWRTEADIKAMEGRMHPNADKSNRRMQA